MKMGQLILNSSIEVLIKSDWFKTYKEQSKKNLRLSKLEIRQ